MKNLLNSILQNFFFLQRLLLRIRYYRNLQLTHKRFPTATFGKDVEIINPAALKLGKNVSFQDHVILHCGGMEWCNYTGGIEIGDHSVVSPGCIFWGCGSKILIGKNFDCGPAVKIFSSRTKYEKLTLYPSVNKHIFGDVVIGDNVICYTNVVIGPGVNIGDGAVIGANSTVLADVAPFSVVAGSPARFIKNRKDENDKPVAR